MNAQEEHARLLAIAKAQLAETRKNHNEGQAEGMRDKYLEQLRELIEQDQRVVEFLELNARPCADVLSKAYELGRNKGMRNADTQNLWGGRVTRSGQAEANARAFIKASEDGSELDWIDEQAMPYAHESDTLEAVRHDLGGSAVLGWMNENGLNEEKAAELTAGEWMMGYTDGICQALLDSARDYIANL
jgi:hypothetical protein